MIQSKTEQYSPAIDIVKSDEQLQEPTLPDNLEEEPAEYFKQLKALVYFCCLESDNIGRNLQFLEQELRKNATKNLFNLLSYKEIYQEIESGRNNIGNHDFATKMVKKVAELEKKYEKISKNNESSTKFLESNNIKAALEDLNEFAADINEKMKEFNDLHEEKAPFFKRIKEIQYSHEENVAYWNNKKVPEREKGGKEYRATLRTEKDNIEKRWTEIGHELFEIVKSFKESIAKDPRYSLLPGFISGPANAITKNTRGTYFGEPNTDSLQIEMWELAREHIDTMEKLRVNFQNNESKKEEAEVNQQRSTSISKDTCNTISKVMDNVCRNADTANLSHPLTREGVDMLVNPLDYSVAEIAERVPCIAELLSQIKKILKSKWNDEYVYEFTEDMTLEDFLKNFGELAANEKRYSWKGNGFLMFKKFNPEEERWVPNDEYMEGYINKYFPENLMNYLARLIKSPLNENTSKPEVVRALITQYNKYKKAQFQVYGSESGIFEAI